MTKGNLERVIAALVVVAAVDDAAAQPLGTFHWQQLPYCNVVSLNVVVNGAVFLFDGTDNQCGASRLAPVTGVGFANPNGTIGAGLTIVTNDGAGQGGAPLHLDVVLGLPSASGTWRDNTGQSGSFTLVAGPPATGSPRPTPVPAFTGGLAAGGARITNVGAPSAASDAVNKAYVDTNVRAALIGEKVWKGFVTVAGVKASTGPYTVSKIGTGLYQVRATATGLGIPETFPVAVATPFTGGQCQAVIASVGYSSLGGILQSASASVFTASSAGTAVDCGFMFMLALPDADSGSPVPPFDPVAPGRDVRCTTTGAVRECVKGAP